MLSEKFCHGDDFLKIKGEYLIREVAGETVAVPVGGTVLNSNILVALNGSGAFFWELLAKGGTEEELVSAVCSEYEIDEETVKADLKEFVDYLKSNKVEVE